MIEVALIGCGHMGRHHARVVAAHPECRLVAVVDVRPERALSLAQRYGARPLARVPEQVDAVIVATPTTTHAALARGPLARGQWALIEKPVVSALSSLQTLEGERVVVGHSERFNPALRALPVPGEGAICLRRETMPSDRGRDVDVVLDLMIHDLDLLLWWANSPPVQLLASEGGGDEARVSLQVGALSAQLYASRVAPRGARMAQMETPALRWDLLAGRAWREGRAVSAPDDRDALTCQWEAFVGAMRGGPRAVTLEEGGRALRLALQIRDELERSAA